MLLQSHLRRSEDGVGQGTRRIQAGKQSNVLDDATLLEASCLDVQRVVNVSLLVQDGSQEKENG
jgi:hypothetical protein